MIVEHGLEKTAAADAALLSNPKDTPSNNSSTILLVEFGGERLLLTADAGLQAQREAVRFATGRGKSVRGVRWMQIPHHGSRYAVDQAQVDYYRPAGAWVSAAGGGHPNRNVIDAFKAYGKVFGTYASGGLRWGFGDAGTRTQFPRAAEPL